MLLLQRARRVVGLALIHVAALQTACVASSGRNFYCSCCCGSGDTALAAFTPPRKGERGLLILYVVYVTSGLG